MINNVQGFGPMLGMQGMQAFRQPKELTDEQKTQIQSILSQYDPSNVSGDDAKAIFKAFREAGIQPGPGIKEAIDAAGFDAEDLRSKGMPEGHRPPPGGGMRGGKADVNTSTLQSLQSILSQYDLASMSSDDEQGLLDQLINSGLLKTTNMIDLSA